MGLPDVEALARNLFRASSLQESIFWYVLWIGLFLATVHFLTMLLTRWGDRAPSTKSLVFSLLLHLSLYSGWTAAKKTQKAYESVPPRSQLVEEDKPTIHVRQIFVDAEQRTDLAERGNTPVWEQLPEPVKQEPTRLDYAPVTFEPSSAPQRQAAETNLAAVEPPDLPDVVEPLTPPPREIQNPIAGPRMEAAIPTEIQEPSSEIRKEIQAPSTSFSRSPISQRGLEQTADRNEPSRGSIDRIAEVPETKKLASLDTLSDPVAEIKRGSDESQIRRRAGPAPSDLPVEEAGVDTRESEHRSDNVAPVPPNFVRIPRRSLLNSQQEQVNRQHVEREPRSLVPLPEFQLSVIEGLNGELPTTVVPEPKLVRPDSHAIRTRESVTIPPTYRLRDLSRRSDVARKYGGTDASERAVEASLQWLALHQNIEGYWDADGFSQHCPGSDRCEGPAGRVRIDADGIDRLNAGIQSDSGLTALALLCFLGAGYTHEEGRYADQVDRARTWLVWQQRSDGYLGGSATHYAKMYCHAMATYALAEAYGMQSDQTSDIGFREPLQKAVNYIIANQNQKDGGWRYLPGQTSDMSMFGWQLMALKSAEIAGIDIPMASKKKMIEFLRDRSRGSNGGLAAYRLDEEHPTPSMTAEALFCKQMLGIERTNRASSEAVAYLLDRLPKLSEHNVYYWYYGTLAMYQYGGDAWRQWNESLRDMLVEEQVQKGHAAGSWDPKPPWGPYGGRIYSTALSTLCLEVYYRFLPLYQMGGRYDAE